MDLELNSGEIIGIIGENGAGKSTFLKILAGLLEPDSGSIEYFGVDFFSNKEEVKRRFGFLPETDSLYENMDALEYLKFFASLYSVKNSEKSALKLLKMLNLLPDKPTFTFSKGMKRKLSIARTLIHNPDILIYDEPTGGLDPSTSLFISNLMKKLSTDGKGIVFSAHNMYYVESTCDRIIILKNGEVLFSGEIEDLRTISKKYILKFTQNGKEETFTAGTTEELNEFLLSLAKEGRKITEIVIESPRLEDLYFQLIKSKS